MTYWEAADILEHGSVQYEKIIEAEAVALKVLKELIKKLDEAEDARIRVMSKIRETSRRGPLYGTNSGVVFVDEFCGEEDK